MGGSSSKASVGGTGAFGGVKQKGVVVFYELEE